MSEKVFAKKQFKKELENGDIITVECKIRSIAGQSPYFSMTGELYESFRNPGEPYIKNSKGQFVWLGSCGRMDDDIQKHFPDLSKYIKWNLVSPNGPMHYIGNTLFFAGDRDCWGRKKGEPSAYDYFVRFGNSPVSIKITQRFWKFLKDRIGTGMFQVTSIAYEKRNSHDHGYSPHYTLVGFGEKWHDCPFRSKVEADEFCLGLNTCKVELLKQATSFSAGKERELDIARRSAIWPDASDEELSVEKEELKQKLIDRLPKLMKEFHTDMEELFGESLEGIEVQK